MASSMPEIGSKISLISKADIRYEGKLFTVDPNECTIALSQVRSFGTEDRQTQYPVPAQSQVYEYILFRGSDIKDISIVPQTLPNDPAIVSGMAPSMPPSAAYPGHNYNHPVMAAPMAPPQYGGYMAPGMGRTLGKQAMPSELVNVNPPDSVQVQVPVIPIVKEPNSELLTGSRSSTPSLARKSPTIDQAVQVSPHKDKKAVQPPVPREGRQNRNDRGYQELYQRRDYRGQRDNQREGEYRGQREHQRETGEYRGQREHQREPGEYRGQRDNLRDIDFRGQRDQEHHRPQENRGQQQQRQNQGQNNNRGGWSNRSGGRGGPGIGMRGRGRGGPTGNFNRAPGSSTGNHNQQQNNPNAPKKNTLKFDEEYDFDKANSEFEELRSKTAKLKISSGDEAEKPKVNGQEDKKDDSGNETGLGEGEPEEENDQEHVVYYDKTKSFFDNISCEAVERSKGRSQRTDWRTERKLNSETFGVASARRGSYRGRGGYFGGGRGMYRGYHRGYNMRGHQGNRNNNQPRPATHIQQPQPVTATAK